MKSEVLETRVVSNLEELKIAVSELTCFKECYHKSTVLTFGREGGPLRIRLIKDTLTDGSNVYNLNIE
jgi:hypothetical protein